MASTYKIYFTNSSGYGNNYAFFSAIPIVENNGGSPVYCNIIASQYVPSDNGDTAFEIDVTQTYYACTFKLINSGGHPAFDPKSTVYDAPDGTYQIASDPGAFMPDQNFLCGLGSVDGNGQRIPVAAFAAQPNTIATVKPVVKFYIAQYSYQKGTIIDVSTISKKHAEIDFTGKAANAAFVGHKPGGGFDIQYGTTSSMLEVSQASASQKTMGSIGLKPHDAEKLINILRGLRDVSTRQYLCKFDWVGEPTQAQKAAIVNAAANAMNGFGGYNVTVRPEAPYSPAAFSVQSINPAAAVRNAWAGVVNGLDGFAETARTIDANVFDNENEPTNGGQGNNDKTPKSNGYGDDQLAQLLKGMKGLDVAAY